MISRKDEGVLVISLSSLPLRKPIFLAIIFAASSFNVSEGYSAQPRTDLIPRLAFRLVAVSAPRQTRRVVSFRENPSVGTSMQPRRRAPQPQSPDAQKLLTKGDALRARGTAAATKEAIRKYQEALRLFEVIGNKSGAATAAYDLGISHDGLGEKRRALAFYQQALRLEREGNDGAKESITMRKIGEVYQDLGEFELAIENYRQALSMKNLLSDRAGAAETKIGLAYVYILLGDSGEAARLESEALPAKRALSRTRRSALTLHYLGTIYHHQGNLRMALTYYKEALFLRRRNHDLRGVSQTLVSLGQLYHERGLDDDALQAFNEALPILMGTGDLLREAYALSGIGAICETAGRQQEALTFYNRALVILRQVGSLAGEADTLAHLLSVSQAKGNPRLAVFYGKDAINNYQQLRSRIGGFDQELQRTYLKSKERTYRTLADLLIGMGRLPEAQQVLGLLKEEEYFQFVRRSSNEAFSLTGRANLTPEEEELNRQYLEIADRVTAIGSEWRSLRDKETRSAEEDQRMLELEKDLLIANQVFQKFLDELESNFRPQTSDGEKVFELREAQGLMNTLQELGAGTVALYTLVGDDKYRVVLITSGATKAYESQITAAQLARKVLDFRQTIQNPSLDPRPLAQDLYKTLIGPKLTLDLEKAGARTLMWSLDGVLRYLPIAALHDGSKYLVERYDSVVFTPASESRLKDSVSSTWRGLGLGVSRGDRFFLQPLPAVPKELTSIIRDETFGPNAKGIIPGRILLDQAFTLNTMKSALRQHYSLVHIASHFRFNPGDEKESWLLLGDGKVLSLAEIKDQQNIFSGVELLTLSACDTGLGNTKADGTEVEGFAVLAQRQGAKAVLATLWPVADESTWLIMQEFYRLRETNSRWTKADALRRAQLALLHGDLQQTGSGTNEKRAELLAQAQFGPSSTQPPFKPNPNAPYSHPYYWAPFILTGNWK